MKWNLQVNTPDGHVNMPLIRNPNIVRQVLFDSELSDFFKIEVNLYASANIELLENVSDISISKEDASWCHSSCCYITNIENVFSGQVHLSSIERSRPNVRERVRIEMYSQPKKIISEVLDWKEWGF